MNDNATIAVDAMGGDNAPSVVIEGAVSAARQWGMPIVLVGDTTLIEAELARHSTDGLALSIEQASEVVGMHDAASDAVRKKKDSSIRVAFNLVREGQADAVVSAGNSGATMAAGMFVLKRIPGVDRPALATIFPNEIDRTLILDVGGNVDCKPVHLEQFAVMGDVYARQVMDKEAPRIGILSNGEEEGKGNELTRGAHKSLLEAPFNYVGYVEGRDIFNGNVDVVVCDGFVGNVLLKVSEGLAETIAKMLKDEISQSFMAKLGYILSRSAFGRFRKRIDYSEYGGAPLLGIQGIGMICHGSSNPKAIKNAIRMANEAVQQRVVEKLKTKVD